MSATRSGWGTEDPVLVDGTGSQGLGVFEFTVPPDANVPPPHSHTSMRSASTCSKAHSATRWTVYRAS